MHETPHLAELEREFQRERTTGYVLVGVLVLADVFMAVHILGRRDGVVLFFAGALFAVSAAALLLPILPLFRCAKRHVRSLKLPEAVGRYSSGQVIRLVTEVLQPYHDRETPTVFLTEPTEGNAFVVNSLFFNFVRPLNAVYLSRHLFRILQPGEIKAVLAHELAHFHRYFPPLARVRLAVTVFAALLPVEVFLALGPQSARAVFAGWLVFLCVFPRSLDRWIVRRAHCHEYLSDYHAARRFGILNMINGLLGLARTSEVEFLLQSSLLRRIREDDTLSLQQLPLLLERIGKELPDKPLTPVELQIAIDRVLVSDETRRIRRPLPARQEREEARRIDALIEAFLMNKSFARLDWASFDCVNPDGRVDATEYAKLIDILEREPEKQIVGLPHENEQHASKGSHPTTRDRILFLERCRREGSGLHL
jgi:Zn-dependent protease with chaperone function